MSKHPPRAGVGAAEHHASYGRSRSRRYDAKSSLDFRGTASGGMIPKAIQVVVGVLRNSLVTSKIGHQRDLKGSVI